MIPASSFDKTEYFAHVLNSQHRFIHETMNQLTDLLAHKSSTEAGGEDQIKTIRALLLYLSHQLEYHFKTEEEHGVFPELLETQPHNTNKIKAIFHEHSRFLEDIRSICDLTEGVYHSREKVDLQEVEERFKKFNEKMCKHDEKETRIIIDSYNLDLGNMD